LHIFQLLKYIFIHSNIYTIFSFDLGEVESNAEPRPLVGRVADRRSPFLGHWSDVPKVRASMAHRTWNGPSPNGARKRDSGGAVTGQLTYVSTAGGRVSVPGELSSQNVLYATLHKICTLSTFSILLLY
jgi:hypothetical protein